MATSQLGNKAKQAAKNIVKPPAEKVDRSSGKYRRLMMFTLGADEFELGRCLAKKKRQLTAAGAKADNLPVKHEGRAKFISALTSSAMKHVREWFCDEASFDKLPDPLEACQILADDSLVENLDSVEHCKLWRAVLGAFVRDEPSAVEDFLKGAPRMRALSSSIQVAESESAPEEVKSAEVSVDTPFRSAPLDGHIAKKRLQDGPSAVPPLVPLSIRDVHLEDRTTLVAIGRRTKKLISGQFFIQIEGIILGEDVVRLSRDEAHEIFPDTGDATAFPGTIHLSSELADVLSVWRVEHKSPDKPTQFVITEFLSHVCDVIRLPYPSSEPDLVREWIQNMYKPDPNILPVFQLADGPIIKLAHDTCDPGASKFDTPMSGYRMHPIVQWHTRTIAIQKFPLPEFTYDCAPIGLVAKRVLRAKLDLAGIPELTRTQAASLADWIANHSDQDLAYAAQRVRRHLNQLISSEEPIDGLIGDILKLPEIAEAVEREKERLAAAASIEAAAARAEISKLAAEKKQLHEEIANLKMSRRKEAAGVAREVKLAFEQAGKEGLRTLASFSIFKTILNLENDERTPLTPTVSGGRLAADTWGVPELSEAGGSLQEPATVVSEPRALAAMVSRLYWQNGLSTRMLQTTIAAVSATGVVGLLGSGSDPTISAIASIFAGGTICSVSVTGDMFGLSDLLNAPGIVTQTGRTLAMPLGEFISRRQASGQTTLVRLRGLNRVPPEALLPELIDAAKQGSGAALTWSDKNQEIRFTSLTSPIVFLLDFAHGRSVFPIAAPASSQVALIDTDAPWADGGTYAPGKEMPLATIDAAFLRELAADGCSDGFSGFDSLSLASATSAKRMRSALAAIAPDKRELDFIPLIVYGSGRHDASALRAAVSAIGGDLAATFNSHLASSNLDDIFMIGTNS